MFVALQDDWRAGEIKSLAMSHGHVMLHHMARGDSGRIVLEIDPTEKDELYAAVTKDGMTLKDWFR